MRVFDRPMRLVLYLIALSLAAYAVERWGRVVTVGHVVEAWWAVVVGALVVVSHLWSAECVDSLRTAVKAKTIDLALVTWNGARLVAGVAVLWSAAGAIVAWRWL